VHQSAYVVVEKLFGPKNQAGLRELENCFVIGVFLNHEDIPRIIRRHLGEFFPEEGTVSFVQKDDRQQQVVVEVHNKKIGVLD